LLAAGALSRPERAIVAAVADAVLPPGGPIAVSGRQAGTVDYFDGYLGRCRPAQRRLVRLLLWWTELSPLLFGPRRARLSRLAPRARRAFVMRAAQSRLYLRRAAWLGLRALLTFAYLAAEPVARAIGLESDRDPFGLGRGAPRPEPPVDGVPVPTRSEERLKGGVGGPRKQPRKAS